MGGYNEEGNADPSMITFVYRTGFKDRKDANHFKPERLNAAKKKTGSDSHAKEVCQSDTSSNSSLSHSGLQSLIPDDSNILQSNTSPDACGVCNNDAVLWKREEKVGFDHKMLCSTGKN